MPSAQVRSRELCPPLLGSAANMNLEFFCLEDGSLLPTYCSVIYLYQFGLLDIYFVLCFFSCSNCSSFSHWELFQLVPAPFCHARQCGFVCVCLSTSLLVLCTSSLSPRTGRFSQEPWFFSFNSGIRNQDVGAGCALHSWGVIASWPSQQT